MGYSECSMNIDPSDVATRYGGASVSNLLGPPSCKSSDSLWDRGEGVLVDVFLNLDCLLHKRNDEAESSINKIRIWTSEPEDGLPEQRH